MTNVGYIDARCTFSRCGHKTHYVVMGRCTNCAWEGYVWVSSGHEKVDVCGRAECPRCECRTIKAGEFVEGNGHVA